ncbi:hypothetical protein AAY473_040236 [Plecturocebus cupreus]
MLSVHATHPAAYPPSIRHCPGSAGGNHLPRRRVHLPEVQPDLRGALHPLCLWCHWAPRHHPTMSHSHLRCGTSKTGMTGMASSLSSLFLDLPWRDLVPPDACT